MNIYLPLEENITDTKFETPHVHKIALQEEEYILLIDDDVDIRELIKDILTMNGFNVLDTSNPIDALDIFKVNKEKIKLVISDIVMPLLSGPELIEQIQKIKSSINVLYITGYTKEIKSIVNTLKPNMAILQKPFDGNTLVDRISHVMEN